MIGLPWDHPDADPMADLAAMAAALAQVDGPARAGVLRVPPKVWDVLTEKLGHEPTVADIPPGTPGRWVAVVRTPSKDGESGFDSGESNISADWQFALMDLVPDDVDPTAPSQVAAYIRRLQQTARTHPLPQGYEPRDGDVVRVSPSEDAVEARVLEFYLGGWQEVGVDHGVELYADEWIRAALLFRVAD